MSSWLFWGAGLDHFLTLGPVLFLPLQSFLHLCVIIQGFPHWVNDVLLLEGYKKVLEMFVLRIPIK